MQLDPYPGGAQLQRAILAMRKGRLREALADMEGIVESSPRNPDYLVRLAETLGLAAQPERAIDYCKRALAINPEHQEAHLIMALQLFRLGRHQEAQEHWRQAGSLSGTPESRYQLARAYELRGDAARMEGILRELAASHPGFRPAQSAVRALDERARASVGTADHDTHDGKEP